MLAPNIITHISQTPIPRIGWKRAGLLGEPRACLGECELGELYALCAVQTTTAEGLAFTRYAGTMVSILESQHDEHPNGDAADRAWMEGSGHAAAQASKEEAA